MKKLYTLITILACTAITANAQLIITSTTNYIQLVDSLILTGVTATNIQYTGAANTIGSFTNGGVTNIGMTDGIVMTTGLLNATPAIGSPVSGFVSNINSGSGYPLLDSLIPGYTTYDASVLEFDLIPVGNVLEFQYVFASEEYPEFVGTSYNDVFGFFISGINPTGGNYTNKNIAMIPFSVLPVAINNVNPGLNATYFVDNEALGGTSIVFDGFTTVLSAKINVVPSSTYHLTMALGDAGDGIYDSGIFLRASSMKSYTSTGISEPNSIAFTAYSDNDKLIVNLQNESAVISIYNMQGQLLLSKTTNQAKNEIDISALPEGMFIIRVAADGNKCSKKFIKK